MVAAAPASRLIALLALALRGGPGPGGSAALALAPAGAPAAGRGRSGCFAFSPRAGRSSSCRRRQRPLSPHRGSPREPLPLRIRRPGPRATALLGLRSAASNDEEEDGFEDDDEEDDFETGEWQPDFELSSLWSGGGGGGEEEEEEEDDEVEVDGDDSYSGDGEEAARALLESIFRRPSAAESPAAETIVPTRGEAPGAGDAQSTSIRPGDGGGDAPPEREDAAAVSPPPPPGPAGAGGGADVWRSALRRLAELSLEDYEWRSGVFRANEADRMVELSIARMRGQDPLYVRPMDAPPLGYDDGPGGPGGGGGGDPSDSDAASSSPAALGPLGRWEKAAVEWLSSVFEEEGRRARNIVSRDGQMVRPLEAQSPGPLGFLERAVVEFVDRIRASERERARTRTLRPKDLSEDSRGPLGELEREAVRILEEIEASEALRARQIKSRGGEMVRPIDVPGPLGDLELAVSELFQAERMRSDERRRSGVKVVRPKDARYRGPLGDAERQAYEAVRLLNREEMNRLESIRRYLRDRRPMEADRDSVWGVLEAVVVGILRAPQLLASVWARVVELLQSEPASELDRGMLDLKGDKILPPEPTKDDEGT